MFGRDQSGFERVVAGAQSGPIGFVGLAPLDVTVGRGLVLELQPYMQWKLDA